MHTQRVAVQTPPRLRRKPPRKRGSATHPYEKDSGSTKGTHTAAFRVRSGSPNAAPIQATTGLPHTNAACVSKMRASAVTPPRFDLQRSALGISLTLSPFLHSVQAASAPLYIVHSAYVPSHGMVMRGPAPDSPRAIGGARCFITPGSTGGHFGPSGASQRAERRRWRWWAQ